MSQFDVTVPRAAGFQRALNKEQQEVYDLIKADVDTIINILGRFAEVLNGRLSFGNPLDENGDSTIDNMRCSWHTQTLTLPTDICTVKTITHNFGIPATSHSSPGDTVYHPNVFWWPVRWQYGDLTVTGGSVANDPPTALAHGAAGGFIYRESGDNVGTNSIELRFDTNFTPTATTPITVTFLLMPGVM